MKGAFANPLSFKTIKTTSVRGRHEEKALPKTDSLLDLLNERKGWHNIDEIAQKTSLPKPEVLDIINFLARYKFILINEDEGKARITEDTHEFLKEIRQEEKLSANQGVKCSSPRRALRSL